MLTVPTAYRSKSATASTIVAGSTSSVWGGSGRRYLDPNVEHSTDLYLLVEDGQMVAGEELQEFVVVPPLRPVEVDDLDGSIGHRMSPVLEGGFPRHCPRVRVFGMIGGPPLSVASPRDRQRRRREDPSSRSHG